jgi:hypothetical protein
VPGRAVEIAAPPSALFAFHLDTRTTARAWPPGARIEGVNPSAMASALPVALGLDQHLVREVGRAGTTSLRDASREVKQDLYPLSAASSL